MYCDTEGVTDETYKPNNAYRSKHNHNNMDNVWSTEKKDMSVSKF